MQFLLLSILFGAGAYVFGLLAHLRVGRVTGSDPALAGRGKVRQRGSWALGVVRALLVGMAVAAVFEGMTTGPTAWYAVGAVLGVAAVLVAVLGRRRVAA